MKAYLEGIPLLDPNTRRGRAQTELLLHYYRTMDRKRHRRDAIYNPMFLYLMAGVDPSVSMDNRMQAMRSLYDKCEADLAEIVFNEKLREQIKGRNAVDEQWIMEQVSQMQDPNWDPASIGWDLSAFGLAPPKGT